jgi:hypothetical protein
VRERPGRRGRPQIKKIKAAGDELKEAYNKVNAKIKSE